MVNFVKWEDGVKIKRNFCFTLFISIGLFFFHFLNKQCDTVFLFVYFFQDPEIGELCQVGGWGRDRKEPHVYHNVTRFLIPYKNPTDLMEVCVPIMDINECRNNYLVKKAKQNWKVDKLSDFKQKVKQPVDMVYDGIHICAGSSSKDSCKVRFCTV